jgi:hypothetical protein
MRRSSGAWAGRSCDARERPEGLLEDPDPGLAALARSQLDALDDPR